jgi:hypothetical protein
MINANTDLPGWRRLTSSVGEDSEVESDSLLVQSVLSLKSKLAVLALQSV